MEFSKTPPPPLVIARASGNNLLILKFKLNSTPFLCLITEAKGTSTSEKLEEFSNLLLKSRSFSSVLVHPRKEIKESGEFIINFCIPNSFPLSAHHLKNPDQSLTC